MSRFLEPLNVTTEDGAVWTVNEPMDYEVGFIGSGERIIVPKGLKTDFGSIPQILWSILSPIGCATRGFVLHDYLYTSQIYTRKKSDDILLEALEVLGASRIKRWTIYAGVRAGGWVAWNGHAEENKMRMVKSESGIVIVAVVFIGLFSLVAGAVTGAFWGAKSVARHAYGEPIAKR